MVNPKSTKSRKIIDLGENNVILLKNNRFGWKQSDFVEKNNQFGWKQSDFVEK